MVAATSSTGLFAVYADGDMCETGGRITTAVNYICDTGAGIGQPKYARARGAGRGGTGRGEARRGGAGQGRAGRGGAGRGWGMGRGRAFSAGSRIPCHP